MTRWQGDDDRDRIIMIGTAYSPKSLMFSDSLGNRFIGYGSAPRNSQKKVPDPVLKIGALGRQRQFKRLPPILEILV